MPKTKKKVPDWNIVTKAGTPQSHSTPKKLKSPIGINYNKWIRGSPMSPKKLNMNTPKKPVTKKSLFYKIKKYIVG